MKKLCLMIVFMITTLGCLHLAAQQNSGPNSVIFNHFSTRNFVTGAISAADLNTILQAAVRSPSAVNLQPWRFTVVRTLSLAQKLISQTVDGNVLIIISAAGDGKTNTREIIDCAIAAENIYLAAQALGYGSRIYTGPINVLNSTLKDEFGIPAGHNAVAIVRVGKQSSVDTVSSASPRKKTEEFVTYK